MSFNIPDADSITNSMITSLKYGLKVHVEVIQYDENVDSYELANSDIYNDTGALPVLEGIVDGSYHEFVYTTDFHVSDDTLYITTDGTQPDHLSEMKITYRYKIGVAKFQSFNVGTNIRTLLDAIGAEMSRSLYSYVDTVANMVDIDSAGGVLLEQLVKPYVGSLSRKPAASASGVVTVENTTGGAITVYLSGANQTRFQSIGGLVFLASEFAGLTTVVIPSGEIHVIYVQCQTTGTETNLGAGTVNRCIDINGLNVDNPQTLPSGLDNYHGYSADDDNTFAGGTDIETDEELRTRFKSVLYGLESGSLSSIRYSLLRLEGVSSVTITDSKVNKQIPYDQFFVTCYDGSGNIITDTNTSLYTEIATIMEDKAPIGIAGVYMLDDTYAVYVRIGTNANFSDTADFGALGLVTTDVLDRPRYRYYSEISIYFDELRTSKEALLTEIKSRIRNYINNLDVGSIIHVSRIHELITGIRGVNRARIKGAGYYLDSTAQAYNSDPGNTLYWQNKGDNNILLTTSYKPRMAETDINDGAITFIGE